MATILDKIVANKRAEVEAAKHATSPRSLERSPMYGRECLKMSQRLRESCTGIISEFKRKSPSKGFINEGAEVDIVAPGYEMAGASGISVLADRDFFAGGPEFVARARASVCDTPLLFKEFIIDPYQIVQAKAHGADCILLIASILTPEQVKEFTAQAHSLGMEVLLELYDKGEVGHIGPEADMVGINNRDLKTFRVDLQGSIDLCHSIPDEFVKVSESGLSDPQTVAMLRREGFRGFLMGENFMKANDPARALANFIGELKKITANAD